MKKDRNCGGNFPVYPAMPYGGMQMGGMPMNYGMPMPTYGGMPMPLVGTNSNMQSNVSNAYSNVESQITNLTNQVNSLEQRVSSLESLVNKNIYSSNYNTSNYQMM